MTAGDGKDDADNLDPSDWLASQFGGDDEVAPPAPPVQPMPPVLPAPVSSAPPVAPAPYHPPQPPVQSPPSSGPVPTTQLPSAESIFGIPGQVPAFSPPPLQPPPPQPAATQLPPSSGLPSYQAPSVEPQLPSAPPSLPPIGTPFPLIEPTPPTVAVAPHHPELPPAVDAALDGSTEVLSAHVLGLPEPVDEAPAASAIDSLFGDDQFREHETELIPGLVPRSGSEPQTVRAAAIAGNPADAAVAPTDAGAKPPRGPISRNQKILMWIAGGLVAILAIVALYFLGTRLSAALGPAPAVTASPSPTPTPTPTPTVAAVGPVVPGEYEWDQLLGGECIEPYQDPWQEDYMVVDCAAPHGGQLVFRGLFPDVVDAVYPGVEELQKRINLLCTPPTIINYAAAGAFPDVQVAASYPATEEEWDAGARHYFCFVSRSSGEPLTASIAVPQVAPAPAP